MELLGLLGVPGQPLVPPELWQLKKRAQRFLVGLHSTIKQTLAWGDAAKNAVSFAVAFLTGGLLVGEYSLFLMLKTKQNFEWIHIGNFTPFSDFK